MAEWIEPFRRQWEARFSSLENYVVTTSKGEKGHGNRNNHKSLGSTDDSFGAQVYQGGDRDADRTKSLTIFGANSHHSTPIPSLHFRET
jgi:hypothetical protein